jgi:oligoribonuclease NrnB/cAMP/cGMP phosphodiesterase (DHH superfamily)
MAAAIITSNPRENPMSKPDICIYHGNCADGFTAAWAIWKRWPDVEFFAGVYGDPPPNVVGKHVLMVDFSYKLNVLADMARSAASVTVLDHHKTAEADLAAWRFEGPLLSGPELEAACLEGRQVLPIQALFDMGKSGAMLAWEYAHPGEPAPRLVQHVQDRDLWRFELEGTRQIQAAVFSHEYDFQTWDDLALDIEGSVTRANIIAQGEAIERKHFKDIGELLDATQRYMVIGGHRVPVANLPYTLASDAANQLAEGNPFAACYFDRADGQRVFSLRSKPEGLDVSLIAASYGGGGHARAAGFQMPIGWEGEASLSAAE